jgi:hypothetical protein
MIEARARINADSGVSIHKMTETKPKSKPKNTLLRPFKCPKLRCPPRKIAIPKLEPGDVSIFMKDQLMLAEAYHIKNKRKKKKKHKKDKEESKVMKEPH